MRMVPKWLAPSFLVASLACGSSTDLASTDGAGAGAPSGGGGEAASPTYHADVAPILAQHCNGCHRADGIAPFAFDGYDAVAAMSLAIRASTEARTMPPWPVDNSGSCHTWTDARWLSSDEIGVLSAWADAGAPEGTPPSEPPVAPSTPKLDVVSATLDMGDAYTPNASVSDDYRCFVVDPGLDTKKFLTAFEVRPGDPRVVHHVIVYALETDSDVAVVEQRDADEPGLGYTCYGGPGVAGHLVAGWAPGTPVTTYPKDTGLELAPNRKLVMQVHYNLAQGPLPDRTRVDFTLADSVKLPARVDLLSDGGFTLPPNSSGAKAGKSWTLPVAGTIYGVFPHMHQLGRSIRVAKKTGSTSSCLADVPSWDFHWQQFYFYDSPIEFAEGDELSVSCTFDTTGVMSPVSFGEGTNDEMCLTFFYSTLGTASCSKCAEVAAGDGDPTNVCPSSLDTFSKLSTCVCQDHCKSTCGDNVCVGGNPTGDCSSCIQANCAAELQACFADK